ncbi:MAG: Tagatose-bisphosphate aldolase [Bryobacterales bacterium]|nr:Tagatose-bisphosphate aldolase [Bryobacterales bacterium]
MAAYPISAAERHQEYGRYRSLREILAGTDRTKTALGHFNAAESLALNGIVAAARDLRVPVMIGVSGREREFLGIAQIAALVRSIREGHEHPIFLNSDHTHSLAAALEAAAAGFDAISFDASALPFEDNVRETQRAVEALRSLNPDIVVEGEIGDIGSGSRIHAAEREEPRVLTTVEEAREFVAATGVDLLAPSVGNTHGLTRAMVSGRTQKQLDVERIREIKVGTAAYLTLHGGSGTGSEDIRDAIACGMNVIHINTEIRIALRNGLLEGLLRDQEDVTPYVILRPAVEAVRRVVRDRLRLFHALPPAGEDAS